MKADSGHFPNARVSLKTPPVEGIQTQRVKANGSVRLFSLDPNVLLKQSPEILAIRSRNAICFNLNRQVAADVGALPSSFLSCSQRLHMPSRRGKT